MLIRYKLATDHPVGKGVALFLLVVNAFFWYVNIMNLGMYGYVMPLDGFIFLAVLIAYFGLGFEYGKTDAGWCVETRWYGFHIKRSNYDNARVQQDGKLYNLWVEKNGVETMTWISFDKKEYEFFKMVCK
ncbi:MAG: hypothetical protein CML22_07440 [Rheinheimera sp.]|nr:hypothetical protein [Rheinheimera sp.]MBM34117.1 hypothetical protein [Rheinheimera sp.]|tara:strand:+ start:4228 stop:4617 length:390 start_codon:yes stop_codon:yes gene_type:complete